MVVPGAAFVRETGYQAISRCMTWEGPQAPPGVNEWKLRQAPINR
jgi:hypothetical protein